MTWLLRNLELCLTPVGLLLIGGAGLFAAETGRDVWALTALVAIGVGVVHGCLFWGIRSRQRRVRLQTLDAIQGMLKDVVNNQLMIIQLANDANQRNPGTIEASTVDHSIRVISGAIASLSDESLSSWIQRYEGTVNETGERQGSRDSGFINRTELIDRAVARERAQRG